MSPAGNVEAFPHMVSSSQPCIDFTDNSATKHQNTHDEENAHDGGQQFGEAFGEIVLDQNDKTSPDNRTKHRADTANQRHDQDVSGAGPMGIGKGR